MQQYPKPEVIKHLIAIGFTEIKGEWQPIWGQGDGEYYNAYLVRSPDVVLCDREFTELKLHLNGKEVSEKELLAIQ